MFLEMERVGKLLSVIKDAVSQDRQEINGIEIAPGKESPGTFAPFGPFDLTSGSGSALMLWCRNAFQAKRSRSHCAPTGRRVGRLSIHNLFCT